MGKVWLALSFGIGRTNARSAIEFDRKLDEYLKIFFDIAAKSKFLDFYRSCNARRHSFRKLARFD